MAIPYVPALFDPRFKTFKHRKLLESLTEYEVRKHCGMERQEAVNLFEVVEPHLSNPTDRGHSIPAETKFLTAMSFFRSGTFQYVEGSFAGVSQSSISRIIDKFSETAVQNLLPASLVFSSAVNDMNRAKSEFFKKKNLPNIIGLVDGTHVYIKAPAGPDEHSFVNRKLKHSINVQVIVNWDHSFLDAVVKYPGATHDAFIWRYSGIRDRFVTGEFQESWLLGDSGYPLEPWLMTPVDRPQNQAERNYNKAHKTTRSLVERGIGIWKMRFRSMHESGGTLCYKPQKCCKLIGASMYLHNLCMAMRIPLLPEDERDLLNQQHYYSMFSPVGITDWTCGVATRQNLITNYFTF